MIAAVFRILVARLVVGIDKTHSMLDHYDAGFTLRTYTHVTRQMQDQATKTMGSFMAQIM